MVQALLLLAEIDERRFALRPGRIEVRASMSQHVEAYAPSFEEAGVGSRPRVSRSRSGRSRAARPDRANLLDNALRHAPADSSVEIHAARCDGGIAIGVDDAGPGIAGGRSRAGVRSVCAARGRIRAGSRARARAGARDRRAARRNAARVVSPPGGARFELWLPVERIPLSPPLSGVVAPSGAPCAVPPPLVELHLGGNTNTASHHRARDEHLEVETGSRAECSERAAANGSHSAACRPRFRGSRSRDPGKSPFSLLEQLAPGRPERHPARLGRDVRKIRSSAVPG